MIDWCNEYKKHVSKREISSIFEWKSNFQNGSAWNHKNHRRSFLSFLITFIYYMCVMCCQRFFGVNPYIIEFQHLKSTSNYLPTKNSRFLFFSLVRFNFGLLLYFFAEIVLFILYHFILSFLCSMPTPIKLSFRFRKMFCGMDGKHTTTTTTVPWITSCTRAKIYTFNLRNT